MGRVTEWKMSEEERLAYIEKYPIKPTEKPKGAAFDNFKTDYKWRGKKAADSRWGNDSKGSL
jgi:hypothetical protein